jgi:lipopolysaccharide/colanic/teichoic acid biosynthesis glycosyltransferase
VSGRNDVSYPERVALDIRYVTYQSLAGDIRILLKTVGVLLTKAGAR